MSKVVSDLLGRPVRPAALALADGTVFRGRAFGAETVTSGEVVFNTAMCGYQEAVSDPSYRGQIITFTYPLIGNYGVSGDHMESDSVHARAVIMREGIDQAKKTPSRTSMTVMRAGNILPGAMVHATSTSKPPPGTYTIRGHVLNDLGDTTDNNGRADFRLLPGSYHFAARDGHGNVGWTEVEIGGEATDVKVVLRPLDKVFPKLPVPAKAREAHKVPQGAELARELLGIYQGSTK